MRILAVVCCALLSVSAHAAVTKLKVTITGAPSKVKPGRTVSWVATVENVGADDASNVTFRTGMGSRGECKTELPALAAGERHSVRCSAPVGNAYYHYVYATANNWDGAYVSAFHLVDIITPPDVVVSLSAEKNVDVGLPFTIQLFVENRARTKATDVVVSIDLKNATFEPGGPNDVCTGQGTSVVCVIDTVPPRSNPQYEDYKIYSFQARAPEVSQASITVTAQVVVPQGDADPSNSRLIASTTTNNTFTVTSAADSGAGSLRNALTAVNHIECSNTRPCKVAFRIPPAPGAKWQTIRPLSPLPPVAFKYVIVDGTTQTRHFGDTNPDGPEIEISGSAAGGSHGLVVASACNDVRGLTVNGFAGYGILIARDTTVRFCENLSGIIQGCYIGTDPTGQVAVPNERGVVVEGVIRGVTESVVSGNRRAGVFVTETGVADVWNSVIGLNATKTAPLPNGASGIYIAKGAHGSDVWHNYIGFNKHAGVSIAKDAWYVEARGNSFQANGGLAIDYELDGVTRTVPFVGLGPDSHPVFFHGTVSYPTIISAVYDAATNVTTIQATVEANGPSETYDDYTVNFYANDEPDPSGFGEGQYYLGSVNSYSNDVKNGVWTFRWPGRLPGSWVAATTTAHAYWGFLKGPSPTGGSRCGDCGSSWTTSEFSATVRAVETNSP